jgi:hypothetical protein
MAMMEKMKEIQAKGGTMQQVFAEMSKNAKPGQGAPPPPGIGPQDPKTVAEQLKTSLEGIKQSAEYLNKSGFVK